MDIPFFQTLPEAVSWHAQHHGQDMALVCDDQSLTFAQLDSHASQVANGLVALGLRPQSRVALLGKDSTHSYEILFGTAKAQAVVVSLNWRLTAPELLYMLTDSEAEVLFVGQECIPLIEAIEPQLSHIRAIFTLSGSHARWEAYPHWRQGQQVVSPARVGVSSDAVVQMYTSGTTGHPKGVQLAHRSFFALPQAMRLQEDGWMDITHTDTLLLSLPVFHIGGLWWAVQGLVAGAKGIILDAFVAWKALQLIEQHRITKVAMVPSMIQFVLAEPACAQTDFSSVTGFLYGGSPVAPSLLQTAMKTFNCGFFQIYGMTETGNMAVCLRPSDHQIAGGLRLKAAGRPVAGVEVCIQDAEGHRLAPYQNGEIYIQSPAAMLGYWKNEQATAETLKDGWIRTGDGGYLDAEGYVYVCDRIKDMIIYAGENIFPAEIEAILASHEAVAEAAVIGVPDERWGETIKAFVVCKPGMVVKQRDLIGFMRGQIADFKLPKSVSFVESLPRNPSGKLLKRILRAPYWEGKERLVN